MLSQLTSDDVLECAYRWLCQQRHHHPPDSDVWHLRFRWPALKSTLQTTLKKGTYQFSPVVSYECKDGRRTCWSAQDAIVLKALTMVLSPFLAPHISPHIYHPKGHGGLKRAIKDAKSQLNPGTFVLKTDVYHFYDQIDQHILYQQFCDRVDDPIIRRLVWQYLRHTSIRDGVYRERCRGISRGAALSPLLGALYLMPIVDVLSPRPVEFFIYMDDILVIAKTKSQLRKTIKRMHSVLNALNIKMHPDKTWIGKAERGFDFLGYHFTPQALSVAMQTLHRSVSRIAALYEQTPLPDLAWVLSRYWQRFWRWVRAGFHATLCPLRLPSEGAAFIITHLMATGWTLTQGTPPLWLLAQTAGLFGAIFGKVIA